MLLWLFRSTLKLPAYIKNASKVNYRNQMDKPNSGIFQYNYTVLPSLGRLLTTNSAGSALSFARIGDNRTEYLY